MASAAPAVWVAALCILGVIAVYIVIRAAVPLVKAS